MIAQIVDLRGHNMGDVVATMKIMPNSPDVDLDDLADQLEASLPDGAKLRATDEEDVAFGLVALLASVIVEDAEGATEAVEEAFAAVDRVESVTVENVGRL